MKRINLLPKPKQRELQYEQLFYGVSIAAVLGVVILLLGILAQLGVWTYFNRSQTSLAAEIETLKKATDKTENAQLKSEIKLINSQMLDFEKLATSIPQWSTVITAFSNQVPRGVKVTQFSAVSKTRKIDISGFSPTRELVIELYNNINADKEHFKDIDYPLENVAQPTNVRFRFTFYVNEQVLVPPKK